MNITKVIQDEYANVDESTLKNISIKETPNLIELQKVILDIFKEVVRMEKIGFRITKENDSDLTKRLTKEKTSNIPYTIKDITKLSTKIPFLFPDIISDTPLNHFVFISNILTALVQTHYDKDKTIKPYLIITTGYGEKISGLCSSLRGPNVRVIGNGGYAFGMSLQSGLLDVEGSVLDYCGAYMHSGKITITNNAGAHLGAYMKGGSIFVEKNTEGYCGDGLSGGKIFVNGKIKSTGNSSKTGGEIYEGTTRVYPR